MQTELERTKAALEAAMCALAVAAGGGTDRYFAGTKLKQVENILRPKVEMETVEIRRWVLITLGGNSPDGFTAGNYVTKEIAEEMSTEIETVSIQEVIYKFQRPRRQ